MARDLPMLVAQSPARWPHEALGHLRGEVLALVEDFPATRLVVYPELHTCRVSGGAEERKHAYEECAEPLDGPRVEQLRTVAREAGVWLVPGSVVERGEDGALYNTTMAIDPDGELAATYRKIFPWRPFEPLAPGDRFVTFDIPDVGRVGLCICYDLWFPEVIRHLAWMGAELVIVPTQTPARDRDQELILTRANAIQNQVFVLSANAAAPVGTGQSILADPEGLVRFQAPSESPAFIPDVIDMDAVRRVREFGTCGLNRMWSQFVPGDAPLPLPLYDGTLDPARWAHAADPTLSVPRHE